MIKINDNNPLISIIIPVYKVEEYLDRCVESVVNQTYKSIEIILVDDGSPDNCPAMCDKWAERDNRIRVIHKANGGLSDARNFGIADAHGEYITFIDSDDYVADDMISTLLDRMLADSSDIALCNYLCVDNNGNTEPFEWENSLPIKDEVLTADEAHKRLFGFMHWHYVIACCKLYKSELFNGFEYPIGKLHEDLHTTHLLFEKCNKISCVHKPLYYYFQNNDSITHTYSIRRLDAVDAYISRFHFYFEKKDYYCAINSVEFMIPKLITAYESLDTNDSTVKKKLLYYKKQYKALMKKVIFKGSGGVDKLELAAFYFGVMPYKAYKMLKRIVRKIIK